MDKKQIIYTFSLLLLCATNSVLPKNIVLFNISMFDIEYKHATAPDNMAKTLSDGKFAVIDDSNPIVIRRYGVGSSYSKWVQIPRDVLDLAKKTLDMNQFHEWDLAVNSQNRIPGVAIKSSLNPLESWETGGWKFVATHG